ncbi:MAG: hypothetical protein ACR2NX_10395, partial [Chthoniobacterales bacterium]
MTRRFLLAALIANLLPVLHAQQTPTSPPQSVSPTPAAPMATPPSPILAPDELPLPKGTPDPTLNIPSILQLDQGFQKTPLGPLAEGQRQHIEWRRLLNQTESDPAVRAIRAEANAAPTDLEKRLRLERYYNLLYRKMTARATPEMRPYLDTQKRAAISALAQAKVRPNSGVRPPTPT